MLMETYLEMECPFNGSRYYDRDAGDFWASVRILIQKVANLVYAMKEDIRIAYIEEKSRRSG